MRSRNKAALLILTALLASPSAARAAWVEQTRLTASDGAPDESFGRSVGLSGDVALIGCHLDDNARGMNAGAAYIFARSGSAWSEQAKLIASDGEANDWFGFTVALSGTTALVAAPYDSNAKGANVGAVYVFEQSGGTWVEKTKLIASDASSLSEFGKALAISGDTALVGAHWTDTMKGMDAGAVYVFVRSGGAWTEQAKLVAGDGATQDYFGQAVALLGDTAVIGAPGQNNANGGDAGAAYLFTRTGATWAEQAKWIASDGAALDQFGGSVALTAKSALVGALFNMSAKGKDAGAVYVFQPSGGTWMQSAKLLASDGMPGDTFGSFLAASGNGAVVGSLLDDNGAATNVGSASVWQESGGTWTEDMKVFASDGVTDDAMGSSLAMSGGTVLAGVPVHTTMAGKGAGAVYVFQCEGAACPSGTGGTGGGGGAGDASSSASASSGASASGAGGATGAGGGNNGGAKGGCACSAPGARPVPGLSLELISALIGASAAVHRRSRRERRRVL